MVLYMPLGDDKKERKLLYVTTCNTVMLFFSMGLQSEALFLSWRNFIFVNPVVLGTELSITRMP